MITVVLHLALLCYMGKCYPALVGPGTPIGTFQIKHEKTTHRGYGGDILVFKENRTSVWAIHRVWLGRPSEHRLKRLQSNDVALRRSVTNGCINVMPDVYAELVGAKNLIVKN